MRASATILAHGRAACRAAARAILLVLALIAAPRALIGQITVDTSSSATASAGTLTWNHTVGSGSGRFLVVGVSIRNAGNTVSSVTYGGAALTLIGTRNNHDNSVRVEMWYRTAPVVGTASVVVTLTGAAKMVGGAVSFFGVSAGAPLGAFDGDSSTNTGTTNPQVVMTSAAGEVLVSALAAEGSAGTVTPFGGQTPQWNTFYGTSGGDASGFGSTVPGAASVTVGWTKTGTAKWAIGSVPLKPASITTLANGADPGNASLAPGGPATFADAFTLQTNSGSEAITAATVTLAAGTSGGLSLVEITNDAGTVVYGSVANPGSDTPVISLSTNITATTTLTQYKIRVTPRSHASMPSPAGSSYAVTARVSGWTGTNSQAGSDAAGTTVTIDNLSPGNVTGSTVTAGAAQVAVSWTNPADVDLASIVVLRRTTSVVTDTPVEGATYTVGNTIGSSTVACVVSAPSTSCTDTGLANGTAYFYKVFARDANGNYATGVAPSGSPVTPLPGISGTVFEDVNYGGGAGRSKASSSGVGRSGARVELYTSAGVYSTFTTTDVNGDYSFVGVAAGTYYVRVVNTSVTSSRTGYTSAALPVQTYRTNATTGAAVAVTDFVGGTNPAVADPGNGSAGATFSTTTFVYSAVLSGTAQSVIPVVVSSASITGLDVGFNFNTVVNTNNAGQGSLRQFIDNANLLGGDASLVQAGLVSARENAVFMISNGTSAAGLRAANSYFSGGVATISPTSALTTISTPMVLDAQKQPGWSSAPIIELNGTSAGAGQNGLTVSGGASIVRGFIINRFGNHGIYLLTAGADTVQGNFVGLNSAGTAASANTLHGIFANNITSTLIGGTTAAARNVVSGNNYGVVIAGVSATGNTVSGNYVGLNAAGTAAVANSIGIDIEGAATGNTIGGTTTAARNVVSGNTQMGVLIQNAGTSGNTVAGNYVGINATGSAAVPNGTHGVNIKNSASGNTVGGTTGTAGNVVSGNTGSGIAIEGAAASGNAVQGNYVGLNPAGTAAIANVSHGVYLNGAPTNTVGGTTAAARNVISGNSGSGIYIFGAGASGNAVRGNYIGTNVSGTAAVANAANGILVEAAPNDTIGGTAAGAGNVISGNTNHGLWLYSTTSGAVVQGNLIGTSAAGTSAIANQVHGLVVSGGATSNTVGGTSTSARNVISGNAVAGIRLLGATTTGNVFQGNYIGVDSTGAAAIGNGSFGIIVDANNTAIGGTTAGAGNLIANNGADGVAVVNSSTGNSILANSIYANVGLGIDLADNGVTLNNGTKNGTLPNSDMDSPVFTSAVLTGVTLTVAGYVGSAASQSTFASARVEIFKSDNDLSGSGEGRVYLGFLTADANGNFSGALTVSGLSVGDKVTGTATDGSNNTSEFGVNFTAVSYSISGTVFEDVNYGGGAGRSKATSSGVARSGARVELYTSAGAYSTFATTDGSGNYSFTGLASGTYYVRVVNTTITSSRTGYTSTALPVQTYRTDATSGTASAVTDFVGGTDPSVADPGNGSAGATVNTTTFVFSAVLSGTAQSVTRAVITAADVTGIDFGFNFNTVVNVNNTGQGSLRQFIANANLLSNTGLAQSGRTAGIDHAIWMISNGTAAAGLRTTNNYFSGGVATITPNPALPPVTDPVVLDAQTQPGWSSAPLVQLSGSSAGAGARGLEITAGGSTVRGFIINTFAGNSNSAGIWIATAGSNTIQGNYLGMNAAGTAAAANYQGMLITTAGNTIGGSASSQRNVISGNTFRGILLDNSGGSASSNVIRGNYIGTNAAGTAAIANSIGIYLSDSPNNTIGGTAIGEGNVTSGNTNFGIYFVSAGTTGNLVQGNTVGLNATRSAAVPNGSSGIEICCSGSTVMNNTIGGTIAAAANVISGNTGRGIRAQTGSGNAILGNSIYGNGGIGIDLGNDNVTLNDGAKPAGTPNLQMDFPVFTSVLLNGTTLTVAGYVGSAAGQATFASARVELFKSDLDGSGNGEGQTYLGFLTSDASGNISGSLTVSGLSAGDKITATATDGSSNTSEFGANVTVVAAVPSMTLSGSATPSGTQPPGTDVTFTTTFTNAGTASAQGIVITNPVPANTDFKLGSVTQTLGTTGLTVTVAYSSNGGTVWTYTPVSAAGGAPAGYDRLVTHIRWTFTGSLSQTAPNNSGSTGATVRIR